ncbi:MAG: DUF87 domain-containing protein [Bacilli bacterium]|nr:DUF87 domain-containing protein [Bacilli bacterium]
MENSNAIKSSKVKVAIGLAFILFGILALIDIGYIIQSIVMGLAAIFGIVAYWIIFPLLILTGLFLIINRNKPIKVKHNSIIIGLALLIFSLLILFTAVPNGDKLQIGTFNPLFGENFMNAIPISRFTNYHRLDPLYTPLGGGWFGHLFAGLLSVITYAGTVASASIFLVIAIVILTHKYIKKFFVFIKNKRAVKKGEPVVEAEVHEPDIIEQAINQAPRARKEEIFSNDVLPDEELKDPSVLEKANLYSNDDAPEMSDINEPTSMGGTLHSANLLDDDIGLANDIIEEPKKEEKILKPYQLPSFDLLKDYEVGDIIAKNEESCANNEIIINATFQALRIGAKVVGHTIGPRITRYDVQVDANASIQAIPRYVSDISQRLGGVQARFEPIVAGKVTSGLEVPNKESATIGFKEIVSVLPKGEQNRLMIPFGKNITGEIKYADLAKFPHLLIGGATGSGKSVFVHSLIMSLIMRNTPSEVRLLLVDPKRVEFTHYKNSPFLLCPVVTDPKKAKVALEKVVEEMERRYGLFEGTMTNNIISYNAKVKNKDSQLPYIVVIVDEFADLIQQNKKIDLDIARITAKARAAGIHLVIATQRPSVDVITGVIKSNLPVRVALSVPDIESSKTIIGGMGAEQLLGNGDMLVSCPQIQASGCVRAQGCYVTDEEIDKVVNFINEQREPNYDPRFMDLEDHNVEPVKGDEVKMSAADAKKLRDEELYQFVKEQVYKREYTSISTIERENGIGFTRAGRLFKRLQDEGLVALDSEASKGSKVLKENFHFEKKEQKIDSEELTSVKPNTEN